MSFTKAQKEYQECKDRLKKQMIRSYQTTQSYFLFDEFYKSALKFTSYYPNFTYRHLKEISDEVKSISDRFNELPVLYENRDEFYVLSDIIQEYDKGFLPKFLDVDWKVEPYTQSEWIFSDIYMHLFEANLTKKTKNEVRRNEMLIIYFETMKSLGIPQIPAKTFFNEVTAYDDDRSDIFEAMIYNKIPRKNLEPVIKVMTAYYERMNVYGVSDKLIKNNIDEVDFKKII